MPAPEEPDSGLESLTVPELKERLDEEGIDYKSTDLKGDLINKLESEGG